MNKTSDSILTRSDLTLLDVLQTPIWIFDIERMRMWWANRAALSLWNALSVEELINRDWSCVSEATQTRCQTYLQQFKQGKTVVEQWTFYPKGSAVSVRCAFSGIQIESGRLAMLVEGVTDVMESIDSETLRSIEALRHTTAMISLYTLNGAAAIQNPAAIRCYGDEKNSPEAAGNAFCKRFVDFSVAKRAMACISAGEVFTTETQVITLNGIRWHKLDVRRINDPATGQQIILVHERDITDRKQVEEQLQKYTTQLQQVLTFEAMLKRITDKVRDSLDESQILQTAVQELVLVLGVNCCNTALYNLEQGTSTICYEYATLNPGAQARVARIANFPEVYQQLLQGQYCQFCSLTPNPVRGLVAMLACPILDDQGVLGDLWLINHKDHVFNELEIRLVQQVANQCAIAIRQARLYQAATAQVEELQKLSQLKDDFLSTISHELRTPVSNMKMAIHLLTIALSQETTLCSGVVQPSLEGSKTARYLQILQDECEREINLINDLLDLQRLEAGAQPMVVETIHLHDWLPRVVKPFQERAKHRQQTLQVDLCSNIPPLVSNPGSLERIVAELLNNACKYTPPGEHIAVTARVSPITRADTKANVFDFAKLALYLTPSASLRSWLKQTEILGCGTQGEREQSEKIQIVVSNSGVEIPVNELPRIFQKFYRVPSTDPWKQSGTGLGLAFVQGLTEHLGGTIQVSSSAGQTVFTVELPINPEKL